MRTHVRAPLTCSSCSPPPWGILAAASLLAGSVAGFVAGRAMARGARGDLGKIRFVAQEQAALRRVTTLAARGVPAAEIFDTVAGEIGRIVATENMVICRAEPNHELHIVASWSARGDARRLVPVGSSWAMTPDGVCAEVLRTGRPVRMTYTPAQLQRLTACREHGLRSSAGCPIVVEGRRWGVLATFFTAAETQPEGVEERMLDFLELVAAAIANAESRAELAASRARVVAAADASRRRIERDLHDGAQQRIVRLALTARAVADTVPPGQGELKTRLSDLAGELTATLDDLREIAHGLHPAILSRGGLQPAISALARRSAVPVDLDLSLDGRLADSVEVAVHYLVSEALTNTAKHARASRVWIEAHVGGEPDARLLTVTIRDDGEGKADPARGQGLIGLQDRVEALGGRLDVSSPPGGGTTLTARIPVGPGDTSHPSHDD